MHDGDTPLRGRGNVLFDSTYPTYDPPPKERRCRISAASVPNEKAFERAVVPRVPYIRMLVISCRQSHVRDAGL